MSTQACPGVTVVAIGKMEAPLVSRGYGAADTFFSMIGLMLFDIRGHGKDVPFLGEHFLVSYHFKSLTPKFTDATEKSVVGEK